MTTLDILTPEVFAPLLQSSRYKAIFGGRGSGKSHFFATELIKQAIMRPGLRAVCVREVQKSLQQSVKQLLEDKISTLGVENQFEILNTEIRTPGGGLIVFQGMASHNAASIKSLEGMDIAWVEEAQTLSARSLMMLRPTIRKSGSELWFSYNPDDENDPVDKFFRKEGPSNAIVVKANYTDNPWLPDELLAEAEQDRKDPDKFAHVWLGEYAKAIEGAYYAEQLRKADEEGRICSLEIDPMLPLKATWDLGVSDTTAIWISQWVGGKILLLDHIEACGQPLSYYVNELRNKGYENAICILPHDGAQRDKFTAVTYESHIRAAGFKTEVVPNQGRGAAMLRIEAARRWFPRMWFDAERTQSGRKALAMYRERRDENRNVGLGPLHDENSNSADALGLLAIAYREPTTSISIPVRKKNWVL